MAGEWTFTTDDGGNVIVELLDNLPGRTAFEQWHGGQRWPTRLGAIEAAAAEQRESKRRATAQIKRLGAMARRERAKSEG